MKSVFAMVLRKIFKTFTKELKWDIICFRSLDRNVHDNLKYNKCLDDNHTKYTILWPNIITNNNKYDAN